MHLFLTLLYGGEWSGSRHGRFILGIDYTEGSVSPKTGTQPAAKENICPDKYFNTLVLLTATRYLGWTSLYF
jgi:hypothetical protein